MIETIALKLKSDVNERFGSTIIKNVFTTAGGMPFHQGGYQTKGPKVGIAELGEILFELTLSEIREGS